MWGGGGGGGGGGEGRGNGGDGGGGDLLYASPSLLFPSARFPPAEDAQILELILHRFLP